MRSIMHESLVNNNYSGGNSLDWNDKNCIRFRFRPLCSTRHSTNKNRVDKILITDEQVLEMYRKKDPKLQVNYTEI